MTDTPTLRADLRAALERVEALDRWMNVSLFSQTEIDALEKLSHVERETHDWYDVVRLSEAGRQALETK